MLKSEAREIIYQVDTKKGLERKDVTDALIGSKITVHDDSSFLVTINDGNTFLYVLEDETDEWEMVWFTA